MRLRRLLARALAVIGVAVAAVLLLHAPLVRRAALRYALPAIEREYGVHLEAERLDYSIATLRVGLVGLRVSSPDATGDPFLTADYLSATLSRRIFAGDVALADLRAAGARVLVRRRADGTTNLPASRGTPPTGADPAPVRIDRIDLPHLSIDLRDEQAIRSLWIPSMSILLTPADGHLRMERPGELRTETQTSTITRLEGEAAFDGRALRLGDLELVTDEISTRLDGVLTLISAQPRLDLQVSGRGDATRLTRWAVANGELPRGELTFEGEIAGPFSDLDTQLRVASDRLEWQTVTVNDAAARVHVTTEAAEIGDAAFDFANGRVQADVVFPFDPGRAMQVNASWDGLDAATAMRAFVPAATMVPSGSATGTMEAQGVASAPAEWTAIVHLDITPGVLARNRVPLAGAADLVLRDGSYRLVAGQRVAGVAPVQVVVQGNLDEPAARSGLAGSLRLGATDAPSLVAALRTIGIADAGDDILTSGTVEGDFTLSGALTDPALDGTLMLHDLTAPRVEIPAAEVTLEGRLLQPDLEFGVEVPSGVFAGQSLADLRTAGRLTTAAALTPGAGEGAGIWLLVDSLSALQAINPGRLTGSGRYQFGSGRFAATIEAAQWSFAATADVPVSGVTDVSLTGEGTVDQPRATGHLVIRGGRVRDADVGTVDARFDVEGREASILASAPEFSASADARIQLEAPYATVVDASAAGLDLARLVRDFELPWPIAGTSTVAVHAELPLQDWQSGVAVMELSSLDATSRGLSLRLDGPGRVQYIGGTVQIDRFEAAVDGLRVSASGALPAFDPAPDAPGVVVTSTGSLDAVARVVAASGLSRLPIVTGEGPVALLARVTGALAAPVIAADVDVGPGSVNLDGLPRITNLRVRAHAQDGWVELQAGGASYQNADIAVTGKAPLGLLTGSPDAGGNAELHARVANLTSAVLTPFVEADALQQVAGSIDVTLEAATPSLNLADLTGELRIDRFDLRLADLPVAQRVPTRIVARDGFARIEAWEWEGQGATVAVRGQVRLSDRQSGILADGVVDLRTLTPFVRGAGVTTAGRLEPRVSITGPLESPRIDGDLVVTGGELRLADPRVLVSDVTARTVLTRTTAQVVSLTGLVNGGALTGSGTVEYTSGAGFDAQLSAEIQGMALEFPQGLRSELDASVMLTSQTQPATGRRTGMLSGTVTVLRGSYREPLPVLTGFLAGLRADQVVAATQAPSFLDSLALDVRIITDEDLVVDNNVGRFQLGADLQLVGTAAAPSIVGRADLREGGQLFVGRNVYSITTGAVDFFNPVEIEPNLNVEAVTRAGGEDIEVTITGPAQSPSMTLSSTTSPELGQVEVASLLLTGRRLDYLSPNDAAFIGAQVLGNLSPELLGFASRAVGLDTLRLGGITNPALRRDLPAVATDVDPTTRLTFGKSLAPNLDVTFSQSLRSGEAQTWVIEYFPRRNLELRLVSDDDDLRSYGFRHDVAFGTGSVPRVESARASAPALRVARVDVTGDLELDERRVRQALRLGPGDRFDFGRWQDDRDRLEALYRTNSYLTARISSMRSDEAGGVVLAYDIAAGPRTRIVVTGMEAGADLRSRLETAWAQSVFDEFLLEEAGQSVRETLATRGYLRASVDVRLADDADERVLSVTVDQGPRSTRAEVRVQGPPPELADAIRVRLAERGLVDTAVSNAAAVERETLDFLRTRGYLRARVTAGTAVFEDSTAVLPIAVEQGPLFSMARVRFEGVETLSEDAVRDVVALADGAPYDPTVVEAARDRLLARYRREGFASASVAAGADVRQDDPAIDIVFAVDEGPRQVLRNIVVLGNRAIDEDVIVRTVGLSEGAPLTADDVIGARTRLLNTGLFRRLDLTSDPVDAPGAGAGTVPMRLRVSVEEWPMLRLRYGFVVAEERPEDEIEGRELVPGLSADIIRRTLFGRAVSVGSAVDFQRREQLGRVFLSTPTLAGLPIESSIIAERSRQKSEVAPLFGADSGITTHRIIDRSSIRWEQRTRVADNLSLSYAYTFERNHTYLTSSVPDAPLGFDLTINVARLNAAGAWDTRDDQFDTTQGLLTSYSFEFAPEAGGSDIRFIRHFVQAYAFRPWRTLVFASAARAGVVVPLGGQEVIPSERFLAGGSRTVRGVAEGGLGPYDFFGATGGQSMVVFNQEARVPVYRWLRAAAFLDAGNVFTRPGDTSLRDLVGTVGFGLRLATPYALLRADYGHVIWGAPGPSTGRWTFGLGQAF